MQKRTLKVALLAVLSVVLVLGMSTVALADQTWTDLPDSVTAKYGVTDNQVAAISDGYAGGLWKPYQSINRAQFTKMAVAAFNIPLADPATASFTDVPKGDYYYPYIEGAKAAGVVNGNTATTFNPKASITRQQALAIIARYVATANGYDLATMYTADEIAILLAHFGDAASISAELKAEMAFAYDMGITKGNDYGNLAPLANLTRIQGAVMLIRAQALVPPEDWTAANIELVSEDKTENLIGQTHQVTFEVTTTAGHPAVGVLVDFDTMFANPLYVGNISPQAAVTNNYGQVTVSLLSTEPGTQRVTATVAGVGTKYTTKYWLAMDEAYIVGDLEAEENVGPTGATELCARVVVIGPGPRSTSQFDWYNVIDAAYDPANLQIDDGVWYGLNDYEDEDDLDLDEMPRTLPGIGVQWNIVNYVNDNPLTTTVDETVPSMGDIVELDGEEIAPAKSALGTTDAEGLSCITLYSEDTGWTRVQAWATYPENPYPQMLFNRGTADPSDWDADDDWEEQPNDDFVMKWIPHVIGGDDEGPITPAYAVNNTGEVETYVLTLEDVYGNPIKDYVVEWWIQGVGFFKSDSTTWVGIGEQNKDIDVTNALGQATLDLKSLIPGQTIVHCKVMDKYGLPYKEWNVVKQWYSIDDVSLGLFDEDGEFYVDDYEVNLVNSGHTWTASVIGAKYVYTMYDLNGNGLRDDQALIGSRADMKAEAGNYAKMDGTWDSTTAKAAGVDPAVAVPFTPDDGETWYVRFADFDLAGAEFWLDYNDDDIAEVWSGLAGKNVYFYNNQCDCIAEQGETSANQILGGLSDTPYTDQVGTITSATMVVTDEMGFASVDINSTNKGYQCVLAVADYPENPQDGNALKPSQFEELRYDTACKYWAADYKSVPEVVIFADGVLGEANDYRWVNPIDDPVHQFCVSVFDEYGNALEGYKVTFEIVGQGTTTAGTVDTYHPYAHFENPLHDVDDLTAGLSDLNPHVDANPYWGEPVDCKDAYDDDYAWGYTLNHEINFTTNPDYAACVDLVMDETAGTLAEMEDVDHYTNIVNVQVFDPDGVRVMERQVVKVWSDEPAELATLQLTLSTSEMGPWSTSVGPTVIEEAQVRVQLLDQYGSPWTTAADDLKVRLGAPGDWVSVDLSGETPDANGYVYGSVLLESYGTYSAVAWIDDGANTDYVEAGELTSNTAKYILE